MPHVSKRRSQIEHNNLKTKFSTESLTKTKPESSSGDDEEVLKGESFEFSAKEMIDNVGDLFALCAKIVNIRHLSTLMYITLRHLKFTYKDDESLLNSIGAMTAQSTN
ncbi:unnamed protein product [Didymodactylos carnosus]|uniref:Uncharacterized protein n=1 Tax=Didymodactylos carnosus TaxID=1234261 RepID=A0A814VS67_9BILA|nr:unnamed protein product [Didymodactylos carnosus]CAF1354138.1 unnamed protein product [Didymodactylos carnosus]CAF3956836.1 unnamed protein product [Didymodactylos carnosus]CAF4164546.1 unnamed protein product [Didymodactylos carnosus]